MITKHNFKKNCYLLALFTVTTCKIIADVESGNWYEKLHWWKKAKPKYEEIVSQSFKVKEIKKELEDKRDSILPTYENLFKDLKIDKNDIDNRINQFIDKYTQILEEDLFDEEDDNQKVLYTKIKEDLDSVKSDFNLFNGLKLRLDEAILKILTEQIQNIDSYEEKALDDFEDIENVLDDKKARELYESIENSAENIKSIYQYLNGPLREFINETMGKLTQLTVNIKFKVDELKKNSIYISQDEENIANQEKEKTTEKQKAAKKETAKTDDGSVILKILNKIWSIIKSPFVFLYNLFK